MNPKIDLLPPNQTDFCSARVQTAQPLEHFNWTGLAVTFILTVVGMFMGTLLAELVNVRIKQHKER